MKCAEFERRYSAWIDTRRAGPLAGDLGEHAGDCPQCAAFVRSIAVVEEACARARAARQAAADGTEGAAAQALADLVVRESRKQQMLGTRRGLLLALAGLLGPGLLAFFLAGTFRPEWGVLLQTVLIAAGLSTLGIELILHAPPTARSQPLPPETAAGSS